MQSDLRHVRFHGMPVVRPIPPARVGKPRVRTNTAPVCRPPDRAVDDLAALILRGANLDPAAYRPAPLGRRLPACLRALKVTSEEAARTAIASKPGMAAEALDTLLIGVSSFFRDPPVFETFCARIVPELARRPSPIRILSVGCSTGAELYSVAMLLSAAGLLDRAHLLGIDCRRDAIARARDGVFDPLTIGDLDDRWRTTYFEPVAGGWRAAELLRRRCTWEVADATRSVPAGPWDVVLCRNLIIYLEWGVAESLSNRLAASLTPGGFLIVGKAERPPSQCGLEPLARCVYRSHDRRS